MFVFEAIKNVTFLTLRYNPRYAIEVFKLSSIRDTRILCKRDKKAKGGYGSVGLQRHPSRTFTANSKPIIPDPIEKKN